MSDAGEPQYQLDHVCLAVRTLGPVRAMLEKMFGYRPRTEPVVNTRQQVRVQFLCKSGSLDIKLIEPSSPQSPLVDFIKRSGGGLHHLAFRTQSTQQAVSDLEAKGARVITPSQPGEAFEDSLIAFLFAGGGLNIEVIETDARRDEIGGPADLT